MSAGTTADLDLSPAPGAAPAHAQWWSQARMEWRLLTTNGEQILLTLVIPAAVLFAVTQLGLATVDQATPGVLALAILSSAFTATAIATGFDRRSGLLKFLGTTPLSRTGLLVGKTLATLGVIVLQMAVIAFAAALLGWSPDLVSPLWLILAVLLGTAALGSWGFTLAGLLRAEATLAVANGIFLLLLFAGGTVLSTDRMPGALQRVLEPLPSRALGDALRIVFNQAPATGSPPFAEFLLLVLWAAGGTVIAARTFRWE
ncbi:MAG: ABC transporter permease [Candidatus Nanopelagicales bacterium]